jgi:predicted P-loop ATPase
MTEIATTNNQISTIRELQSYLQQEWLPSIGAITTELPLLDYEIYFRTHYVVRYNEVDNKYENAIVYTGVDGQKDKVEWKELVLEELLNDMIRAGAKRGKLSKEEVSRMLADRRLVPRYNPFIDYFKSIEHLTKNDTFDYIEDFANYVKIEGGDKEQARWVVNFKKALVRNVRCAIDDRYFNKHCLILQSADQSTGKTSFIRAIYPEPFVDKCYQGTIGSDKDSQTLLAKSFIILLDELAELSRMDINVLKATLSKLSINLRLPFAPTFTEMPRRASFWGTTNRSDFLTDSQNVRWLVFAVESIDRSYGNVFTGKFKIDRNKVWSQAYNLYLGGYDSELSKDDMAINEDNNLLYSATSLEKEVINTYFSPAKNSDNNKKGFKRAQPSEIFELACKHLESDNKLHTLKNIRQNIFFSELSRLVGWKKVSMRIGGKPCAGYYFLDNKEVDEGELPF